MGNGVLITNIQRMCFHDGPGIRTTVFFKGCSLHCPWCSNPENIHFGTEKYLDKGKECIYGKNYTAEELVRELLKDKDYWTAGGGVTFSGGEALLQVDGLCEIAEFLKAQNIHIAVETALFVPTEYVNKILPFVDYFLVDIKILEASVCQEILGGDVELYKTNVELLYKSGKPMKFRIPCSYEYTLSKENKELLKSFLCEYRAVGVELFKLHRLGAKKYEALGRQIWNYDQMSDQDLEDFCDELRCCDIDAKTIHVI